METAPWESIMTEFDQLQNIQQNIREIENQLENATSTITPQQKIQLKLQLDQLQQQRQKLLQPDAAELESIQAESIQKQQQIQQIQQQIKNASPQQQQKLQQQLQQLQVLSSDEVNGYYYQPKLRLWFLDDKVFFSFHPIFLSIFDDFSKKSTMLKICSLQFEKYQ